MESLQTKKTSYGSNFGWPIRQMSINQKSGRQTFRRRFVSGSLQSETKIEPDLRLTPLQRWKGSVYTPAEGPEGHQCGAGVGP